MKKITCLLIALSTLSACSDDFSDCEKIGHAKGVYSVEDCADIEIACEPGYEQDCKNLPDKSTPQGCAALVAELNRQEEQDMYILRCPLTKSRAANKTTEEYAIIYDAAYVYNNGTEIKMSDLLADKENIYIFSSYQDGEYNYLNDFYSDGYRLMRYKK